MEPLRAKLQQHNATAAVIGLGYVGLPLALEIASAGFKVVGIDLDQNKIATLKEGQSYIGDVSDKTIADAIKTGRFTPTSDFSALRDVDTVSICVPTPLSKSRDPDISFILSATEADPQIPARRPAHCAWKARPILAPRTNSSCPSSKAAACGSERTSFSPFHRKESIPAIRLFNTRNTPKIVGGITAECTEIARVFYSQFIERVIAVSSTKCAEMVKLLENTFRSVNIGMVNELALMCDVLGVDVYEVIDAAATKPFGFIPFYPGPGLGGHCIPIDPHYLAWKLKALNFQARFIGLAAEINGMMPSVVTSHSWRGAQPFFKKYSGIEGFDSWRRLQEKCQRLPGISCARRDADAHREGRCPVVQRSVRCHFKNEW